MVDVGDKVVSDRRATARCEVVLPAEVWKALAGNEITAPKGPVLATATIAGVCGAKKTSELIPFCHQVSLDDCQVRFTVEEPLLRIECSVRTRHRTGVEMEALTGAAAAALCVHDMCKALSPHIKMTNLRLVQKSGGKSDFDDRAIEDAAPDATLEAQISAASEELRRLQALAKWTADRPDATPASPERDEKGTWRKEEDAMYLKLLNLHGKPVKANPVAQGAFFDAFPTRLRKSIVGHIKAFEKTEETGPWIAKYGL
ncbi:MoaC family-domain-containing protein [Pelagophyceae sp. CCMP2097]|nr:MoaC family-domain-containing protein [Pelagophyceae sp. CCMP2097]